MKKNIRNIIILIIISLLIPIALGLYPFLLITNMSKNAEPEIIQNATIIIDNEGEFIVKEKIIFSSNENIKYETISIKKSLWAKDENKKYKGKKPRAVTVKLNDKLLENSSHINQNLKTTYYQSNTGIVLKNVFAEKDKTYQIDFYYEYNAFDVVEEYKNVELLRLMTSENVQDANIKIQLPQNTNIFEIKSNAQIEYCGNNTYNINGKMRNPYTELLIDKGCIENAKIINKEFEKNDVQRTLMEENSQIIKILKALSIITLIEFVITLLLTRKFKIEKNYVRNPEEVIEPILAESMIDRKIGAKELIMSCIVDLIYRGNIRNVENEKIHLISEENISEYEQEIISLIFKEKNQIVTFEEIKNMFIDSSKNTQEFFDRFKVIKEKIKKRLFDYHIYSKVGEVVLKILRVISIIILINIPYILFVVLIPSGEIILSNIWIYNLMIALAVIVIDINLKSQKKIKFEGGLIYQRVFAIFFIIGVIVLVWNNWYKHLGAIILISIIFILNLIIFIKSKSHVFTRTGKIEFARVQGLKNYIVDYSLMKERELDSVIIWDEYLAYAVAFGIPNKITDKFNENLMNTNIVLQKLENILKM